MQLGDGNQPALNWTHEYNLRSLYGLPDLTPRSFAGLFLLLLTPGDLRDSFIEFYNSGAPFECGEDCQNQIIAAQIWGPFPQSAPKKAHLKRSLLPMTATGRSVSVRDGRQAPDPNLCAACTIAMTLVDSLFALNATDDFIIEALGA